MPPQRRCSAAARHTGRLASQVISNEPGNDSVLYRAVKGSLCA